MAHVHQPRKLPVPGISRSTKAFIGYPCSHRQWRDSGHCAYIHGYSRSFHLEFQGDLDDKGWVKDFGDFKNFQAWLKAMFDHTLLLDRDDPLLGVMKMVETAGGCKIVVPPYGPSMEATARWVYEEFIANHVTVSDQITNVQLIRVEVRENEKNSGIFEVPYVWSTT